MGTREIKEKSNMLVSRGDAQAVMYNPLYNLGKNVENNGTPQAYIMGGFTHQNSFCKPLYDGEQYDFVRDKWTQIDSLSRNRGDKAVVLLFDKIYTIGGETKHEYHCDELNVYNDSLEPESHTVTVPDIESYKITDVDPEWIKETNLPFHRFRSAAAAVNSISTVFVFGGQDEHNAECECYKTSDVIVSFKDNSIETHSAANMSNQKSIFMVLLFSTFFGWFSC